MFEKQVHGAIHELPWDEAKTNEEARAYHEGFLAGMRAYCRALGHASIRINNPLLATLVEEQSQKTIRSYKKIAEV